MPSRHLDAHASRASPGTAAAGAVDADLARCLALMLDEIDYGALLVGAAGRVRLMNHAARQALEAHHPLQVVDGELRARSRADGAGLQAALEAASLRAVRQLLLLGHGDRRASIAIVPLGAHALEDQPATMLLLSRRRVCEVLSVQGFARNRGLTPTESRVLEMLCGGEPPAQIASALEVRISTVRSHLAGIREKTGAHSIRALVRMVAVLPPMVPSLRPGIGLLLEELPGSR